MNKQFLLLLFITVASMPFALYSMEMAGKQMMEKELQQFREEFHHIQDEYREINKYYQNNRPVRGEKRYIYALIDNLSPDLKALRKKIHQYVITLPDTAKTNPSLRPVRTQLINLLGDVKEWDERISRDDD